MGDTGNGVEDVRMIAAFMCAAIFLVAFSIVGAIRLALTSGKRSWHDRHHTDNYVEGCKPCWFALSDEERSARIRVNLDRAQAKRSAESARRRADFEASYPTHPSH